MPRRLAAGIVLALLACVSGPRGGLRGHDLDASLIPDGHGWACGARCARSDRDCRALAGDRSDLRAAHEAVVASCQPADRAYCITYVSTLADVTRELGQGSPGRMSGDRTPRHDHECFPSPPACDDAAARRGRQGYQRISTCTEVD